MKGVFNAFTDATGATDMPRLAEWVYRLVFRTDFASPGFALLDLFPFVNNSVECRRTMVDLKRTLDSIHDRKAGKRLVYRTLERFDQQETTKLHRDGGPEDSILMLGYEPTSIASRLFMADYSQCAHDMGMTPTEFLQRHNPMFKNGEELLDDYTVEVEGFNNRSFQIVIINNSCRPYCPERSTMQGVLHQAIVDAPNSQARRIVNSTMVESARVGEGELESRSAVEFFLMRGVE